MGLTSDHSPMRLPIPCPRCQAVLECHDSVDDPGAVPVDGDVALCAHCGALGVFEGGKLRLATPDELEKLLDDRRVQTAVGALAATDSITEGVAVARAAFARGN